MDEIKRLNRAISYIEDALASEIDVRELCRICCCSLVKFQQMFSMVCGVPVSEYIRNRRMTLAAYELIHTNCKIIDLALRFGYDSPEAFTRAYTLFHGVSPSVTRKTGKYEEYFRVSIQIQVYGGKFKMGMKPIVFMETERLVIRKFSPKDWRDLLEIAISKARSAFADCDWAWPTDEEGTRRACEYFSKEHTVWAAEVKSLSKVVCFIHFNDIDENGVLDIGHVINDAYLNQGYEYEALKALYNYGFLELGASEIVAFWALHDEEKLAPLRRLGMKVGGVEMADCFRKNPDGTCNQFESCRLSVTREEWIEKPKK